MSSAPNLNISDILTSRTNAFLNRLRTAGYDAENAGRFRGCVRSLDAGSGLLAYDADEAPPPEVNEKEMSARFIITTPRRDRYGDIVVPRGITGHLDNYRRNPRVFFSHQSTNLPIASARDKAGNLALEIFDDKIISTAYFHGETAESNIVFALVRRRELEAASIGFLPVKAAIIDPTLEDGPRPKKTPDGEKIIYFDDWKSLRFEAWDMTEWSIVPCPANPAAEALAMHLSRGHVEGEKLPIGLAKSLAPFAAPLKIWSPGVTLPKAEPALVKEESIDPVRWNKALTRSFDIRDEDLPPACIEYDFVSQHLACEIKEVHEINFVIPSAKLGSFLTAWNEVTLPLKKIDTRNIVWNGSEAPPRYEVIQLNSEKKADFLVQGAVFYRGDLEMVTTLCPTWYGLSVTLYSRYVDKDKAFALVDNAWTLASTKYNFLKGEAFSLSGDFIPKTADVWEGLFLNPKNEKCLKSTLKQLNEKQSNFANRGVIFMGPPGCLHGNTLIQDPVDGSTISVKDREMAGKPFHVWAKDQHNNVVIAKAEKPWQYEQAEMVKFTFASGTSITVTKGHKFWGGRDYVTASEVFSRQQELGFYRLPSISVSDLLTQRRGAPRLKKIPGDYSPRYLKDSCPYGAQPLSVTSNVRAFVPSQVDALRHTHEAWRGDGPECKDTYNFPASSRPPSSKDCSTPFETPTASESLPYVLEEPCEHVVYSCLKVVQQHLLINPSRTKVKPFPFVPSSKEKLGRVEALSYNTPVVDRSWWSHTNSIATVVKAEAVESDNYYDFHVPIYENYWAEGVFHHNTGKTLSGRVIRNEAKSTFIWVSARDFYRSGAFGGLSYAFSLAKELSPSVLFIEDVDHWLDSTAIDLVKTEMDGIGRYAGVWTVLTTNFPESLPEALIDRPGRFHDVLNFNLPDATIRQKMLKRWLPDLANEDLDFAVKATAEYSGAHVYELAHFSKVLREEGISLPEAVKQAIDKVKEQRDLISTTTGTSTTRRRFLEKSLSSYTSKHPCIRSSGRLTDIRTASVRVEWDELDTPPEDELDHRSIVACLTNRVGLETIARLSPVQAKALYVHKDAARKARVWAHGFDPAKAKHNGVLNIGDCELEYKDGALVRIDSISLSLLPPISDTPPVTPTPDPAAAKAIEFDAPPLVPLVIEPVVKEVTPGQDPVPSVDHPKDGEPINGDHVHDSIKAVAKALEDHVCTSSELHRKSYECLVECNNTIKTLNEKFDAIHAGAKAVVSAQKQAADAARLEAEATAQVAKESEGWQAVLASIEALSTQQAVTAAQFNKLTGKKPY